MNIGAKIDDWLIERGEAERCAKCGLGPFDDEREQFGDRVALMGILGGATAGSTIAEPFIGSADAVKIATGKVLQKTDQYENIGERVEEASIPDAIGLLEEVGDEIMADVEWKQINGEPYCYECHSELEM